MESTPAVDSSPQIWSICLSHADKFDRALVETWKGDMDGILIFVGFHIHLLPSCLLTDFLQSGLFSAVVTAFLIISYPNLQPDVPVISANLTAQVAILLAESTNQSDSQTRHLQSLQNQLPSPNSHTAYLIINALWFLSLAFGLACALAATLVQQWSRTYLQGTEERFNPHQRVRMRTYLQRGVQKFHFSELVDAIPMWVDLISCLDFMISRNITGCFTSLSSYFFAALSSSFSTSIRPSPISCSYSPFLRSSYMSSSPPYPSSSMTAHTRHHSHLSCRTSLMP